jgi:hypothetical protein
VHILFIDESGVPPPPGKQGPSHFVLGGLVIPEEVWPKLAADLLRLKNRYDIVGEIKWRYFVPSNKDKNNSLAHLTAQQREELRASLFEAMVRYKSLRAISVVANVKAAYAHDASLKTERDLYHRAYKVITERFQYFLQDLERLSGQRVNGLIVCDHRQPQYDKPLQDFHQRLLTARQTTYSSYNNLIEGLFIAPSHHSIGIQFADLVAGAMFRKFANDDPRFFDRLQPIIRKSPQGKTEGYGIVRVPKD